jgi:hypothetical protein
MGLPALLRNFFQIPKAAAWFPKRNEAFRGACASDWNRYGRRISHFAGSFVFKGLATFSFRPIHGLFVFNALAPFFISPRNPSHSPRTSRLKELGASQGK